MACELTVVLDGSPEQLLDIQAPGLGTITEKIEEIETDISDLKEGISNKADVIVNSASGSIASFTDGADDLPLKKAIYYIEPKQSGTGDPSPDNIRPISGWTGMTVQRTGKNLLGTLTNGKYINASGDEASSSLFSCTDFIKVEGQTTITFSGFPGLFGSAPRYAFYDTNKSLITAVHPTLSHFTVAIPADAVWFRTSLATADVSTAMIEFGSTETDYEQTSVKTIPITFPTSAGTVYGGNVVVNEDGSGVLTVNRAFYDLSQFSSASNWSKSTRYLGGFYRNINSFNPAVKQNTKIISCSHAKTVSSVADYVYGTCFVDSSVNLRIMPEDATTQDWVDYIIAQNNAGTPICIVVEIATQLIYNLTAEQISTLLGVNNVWCDTGDSSVEYRADTKLYIDELIGTTDDDYTANQNIASGQFFSIGNHLYRATSAIASGATIVPGTNCTETNIAEQLTALYASLN